MKVKELADFNPSPSYQIQGRRTIDYIDTASVVEGNLCCVQRLSDTFPSRAQREIKTHDILISSVRPNLKHNYFVGQGENDMIASSGFIHIRVKNPMEVSPLFMYYFLTSPTQIRRYAKIADSSQSAYPSFNKDVIEDIEFPNISLPTQLRIAGVLGSIDEKMELNRKKIAELESLAKTIYDYWFVQFDFPDKNGKPYKSSGGKMVWNEQLKREVPAGWEVCRIGEHITSNRGVSYGTKNIITDKGYPMINLNSFNVDSSYKASGLKFYDGDIPKNKLLSPFDLVMCNTQQTDLDPKKDIIGKSFLIPDIFPAPITSSHHVTSIHVDDDDLKVLLNALFSTREFHSYISGYASGTSIKGLDFFGVENCFIALPAKPIMSKFAEFALACEKAKSIIISEQALLQPLRDFLLPLLMNGQAVVE